MSGLAPAFHQSAGELGLWSASRLFVNAAFQLTGLPVPDQADVTPVGEFQPTKFGFNGYRKGVKVSDHNLH